MYYNYVDIEKKLENLINKVQSIYILLNRLQFQSNNNVAYRDGSNDIILLDEWKIPPLEDNYTFNCNSIYTTFNPLTLYTSGITPNNLIVSGTKLEVPSTTSDFYTSIKNNISNLVFATENPNLSMIYNTPNSIVLNDYLDLTNKMINPNIFGNSMINLELSGIGNNLKTEILKYIIYSAGNINNNIEDWNPKISQTPPQSTTYAYSANVINNKLSGTYNSINNNNINNSISSLSVGDNLVNYGAYNVQNNKNIIMNNLFDSYNHNEFVKAPPPPIGSNLNIQMHDIGFIMGSYINVKINNNKQYTIQNIDNNWDVTYAKNENYFTLMYKTNNISHCICAHNGTLYMGSNIGSNGYIYKLINNQFIQIDTVSAKLMSMCVYNNELYIGTNGGTKTNLLKIVNDKIIEVGIQNNIKCSGICVYNNELYACGNQSIYRLVGNTLDQLLYENIGEFHTLCVYNGDLYMGIKAGDLGSGDDYLYKIVDNKLKPIYNYNFGVESLCVYNNELYIGGSNKNIYKLIRESFASQYVFYTFVYYLCSWNDELYIGSDFGLYKYHYNPNESIYVENTSDIRKIFSGNWRLPKTLCVYNGDLYMGNHYSSSGVFKYDGTTFSKFGTFDKMVNSLCVWKNELYLATIGQTPTNIYKLNTTTGDFESSSLIFPDDIFCLCVWNGELYLGGFNTEAPSKVWRYDGTGFEAFGNFKGGDVSSLCVYNGELYLGCDIGVYKLVNNSFVKLTNNNTQSLYSYNGELYLGGAIGIYKYDGNIFNPAFDFQYPVYSFIKYNDELYFASDSGSSGDVFIFIDKQSDIVIKTIPPVQDIVVTQRDMYI